MNAFQSRLASIMQRLDADLQQNNNIFKQRSEVKEATFSVHVRRNGEAYKQVGFNLAKQDAEVISRRVKKPDTHTEEMDITIKQGA